MASITIYEISGDPFGNPSVTITEGYQVEITDDDGLLEDPDGNGGQQFNTSTLPNLDNSGNLQIFEGYTATVSGAPVTYTLINFSGTQYIVVTSGDVEVGDVLTGNTLAQNPAPPVAYDSLPSFVCFTSGSYILTPSGRRLIEEIKVGDQVIVADGTSRAVRWVGRRWLSEADLHQTPKHCPIRISAGSLGPQTPSRDLLLSPQHRVVVSSPAMELHHSHSMMLATAKSLVNGKTINQLPPEGGVEYIHILFDQHELVNVEGLWSESFYPGDHTLDVMSVAVKEELFDLFPELQSGARGYGDTVLPVLRSFEVQILRSGLCAPSGTTPAFLH
ncbi:Hint domain-containing protein [Ruegeria conchae]|uniref:Hint domain-containing protein n=1 Tax=Ruegeria conchae TaxID=981384 RepID=UPI00147EFC4B|nr:Hint domain-containing protein [Ruegeria conchae]UWR02641.1 Hint domain-containing protein [Ruegeria conchae]